MTATVWHGRIPRRMLGVAVCVALLGACGDSNDSVGARDVEQTIDRAASEIDAAAEAAEQRLREAEEAMAE